jgi:hypothetical protein
MKHFPWWFVAELKFFFWFHGVMARLIRAAKTKAEKQNRVEIVARCNIDLETIERERNQIGATLFIHELRRTAKKINSEKDCRITTDSL